MKINRLRMIYVQHSIVEALIPLYLGDGIPSSSQTADSLMCFHSAFLAPNRVYYAFDSSFLDQFAVFFQHVRIALSAENDEKSRRSTQVFGPQVILQQWPDK